jgi:hypothetical protein
MIDPLSGGPAGFPELLACQLELPAMPTNDPEWILVEEGFTPAREHELESLYAIGNGYVGSRGSLAEGSALSAPGLSWREYSIRRQALCRGLRRLPTGPACPA